LILRIIQDSSVSHTSHHPQFGRAEATAILVTVIPVCFNDVDNAGIIGKTRLCCKSLEARCPREILAAARSRIHICKEAMRRLKSTRKSFTQDARNYVTEELWAVSYSNPMRKSAIVPPVTT